MKSGKYMNDTQEGTVQDIIILDSAKQPCKSFACVYSDTVNGKKTVKSVAVYPDDELMKEALDNMQAGEVDIFEEANLVVCNAEKFPNVNNEESMKKLATDVANGEYDSYTEQTAVIMPMFNREMPALSGVSLNDNNIYSTTAFVKAAEIQKALVPVAGFQVEAYKPKLGLAQVYLPQKESADYRGTIKMENFAECDGKKYVVPRIDANEIICRVSTKSRLYKKSMQFVTDPENYEMKSYDARTLSNMVNEHYSKESYDNKMTRLQEELPDFNFEADETPEEEVDTTITM